MPFTWDVSAPAGTDAISAGDDQIRTDKTTLQNVLKSFMRFPNSSSMSAMRFVAGTGAYMNATSRIYASGADTTNLTRDFRFDGSGMVFRHTGEHLFIFNANNNATPRRIRIISKGRKWGSPTAVTVAMFTQTGKLILPQTGANAGIQIGGLGLYPARVGAVDSFRFNTGVRFDARLIQTSAATTYLNKVQLIANGKLYLNSATLVATGAPTHRMSNLSIWPGRLRATGQSSLLKGLVVGPNAISATSATASVFRKLQVTATAQLDGVVDSNAAVNFAHTTITGATTLGATNMVVSCNTASAGFTVQLPTASGVTGRTYIIKKTSASNTLTVQAEVGQTIDGTNTASLTANNAVLIIISNGTNWIIAYNSQSSGSAFSGVRAYHDANQTTLAGSRLDFNSERYDTDSYHSTAAATDDRFTIPATDYYHVGANVRWFSNFGSKLRGRYAIELKCESVGTAYIAVNQLIVPSGLIGGETPTAVYLVAGADYYLTQGQIVVCRGFDPGTGIGQVPTVSNAEMWLHRIF